MLKANWIWAHKEIVKDEYVRFAQEFTLNNEKNVVLKLSCDSIYNVWVNGKFVGFGMMYDYEHYKMLDEYDITAFCKAGVNRIEILVWYTGMETNSYRVGKPGCWFEVCSDTQILAVSNENTQCKFEEKYVCGNCQVMTGAIGYTYKYDNMDEQIYPYQNAVVVDKTSNFGLANAKNLQLGTFSAGKIVKKEDGRIIVDLGKEYWGFLSYTFTSSVDNNHVRVAFGEHLGNSGGVIVTFDKGKSIYAVDFVARKGKNSFTNLLRAVGCRYLEFIFDNEIEIEEAGVYPLRYPFEEIPFALNDEVEQKIYDMSLYTMYCSTSKHYVDCPWREQSLYILDARNQMLFGYYAFKNIELARYNLIFIAKGLLEEGLLPACPPTKSRNIIPFFNLIYFMQVKEYLEYTDDESVLPEILPTLEIIMNNFLKRIDLDCGLLNRFTNPYWNFYEWTEGNDHWEEKTKFGVFDLILNCMFVIAVESYQKVLSFVGKEFSFDIQTMREKIYLQFFDEEMNLFRNDNTEEKYSRMGNGIAILAGIVTGEEMKLVADAMINNLNIVDVSLASATFYYDALLKADKEKYDKLIRQDLRKKYSEMMDKGATTFWETLKGAEDFGGSGSLCHGWSALPVYYYHILQMGNEK